jgi:hypothetical protein
MTTMTGKRALLLALCLLAVPAALRAACPVETGDFDGNGTTDIRIDGNGAKQRFLIDVQAAQTLVSISCNGDLDYTDPGDMNAQAFPGGFDLYDLRPGGSDVIDINFSQSLNGASKIMRIPLFGGNNVVSFSAPPGVTFSGQSRLVIEVAGYLSADVVNLQLPALNGSAVLLRTDLSIGNDTVNITLGNMTAGALLDVDATQGGGNNVFTLTQPAGTTLTGSTVEALADSANGVDHFTANLAGVAGAGARLRLVGDMGESNDVYTANLDLASFEVLAGGEVVLDARGGNGSDVLTVTRNGSAGGAAQLDGVLDVRLAGGVLGDILKVDLAGGGFAMGGGRLRLRAEGGAANDILDVKLDASGTPVFDVLLHGGPQNDTVDLVLNNSGANGAANYGPAGQVLLDASFGVDVCSVSGNPLVKIRNCE